jgi:hypothetical protein
MLPKKIDKRCPFPISHSVPFLLPLSLIFSSTIPTGTFFLLHTEGNGIIRQAVPGSAAVTCSVRQTAVTNEGSRCHVRTAQSVEQDGKSTGKGLVEINLI